MKVGLWKTSKGNAISHKEGLTEDQVKFFQGLQKGDRLVLWVNNVTEGERRPNFTLEKSILNAEVKKSA